MALETFLTALYVTVDDLYQSHIQPQIGNTFFRQRMSREEKGNWWRARTQPIACHTPKSKSHHGG
jgi:hypothetical protein